MKHLEIDLEDESIDLNYESVESINDIVRNIQKVCLDDNYMMNMYEKKYNVI
jgi:hypothetical protein